MQTCTAAAVEENAPSKLRGPRLVTLALSPNAEAGFWAAHCIVGGGHSASVPNTHVVLKSLYTQLQYVQTVVPLSPVPGFCFAQRDHLPSSS